MIEIKIEDLRSIEVESERVSKLYEMYDEDNRILASRSGNVEFVTTIHYIDSILKPNDRILDIGAGTGAYSLYYDTLGYSVTAVELASRNVEVFKSKISGNSKIDLIQGNALDLSKFKDKSFDVVLLFGPLYHLLEREDRDKAIAEAKRVLKDDGILFITFINHDIIHMSETNNNPNWFEGDYYNHETFRIENFPFVFFTLDECRDMITSNNLKIEKEIASDGLSELLAEKINQMSDSAYEQYLRYHLENCEDVNRLKCTNHFLFQCRK